MRAGAVRRALSASAYIQQIYDKYSIPSSVERMLESLAISEIDMSLAICAILVNRMAYIANICTHNYLLDS